MPTIQLSCTLALQCLDVISSSCGLGSSFSSVYFLQSISLLCIGFLTNEDAYVGVLAYDSGITPAQLDHIVAWAPFHVQDSELNGDRDILLRHYVKQPDDFHKLYKSLPDLDYSDVDKIDVELKEFLYSIHPEFLLLYEDVLNVNGYDTLNTFTLLTDGEMDGLNIKRGHRALMMNAIDLMRATVG